MQMVNRLKTHLLLRGAAAVSVAVSFMHKLVASVRTCVRSDTLAYHLGDVASSALQLLSEALVHGIQVAGTLDGSAHDACDQRLALLVLGGNLMNAKHERIGVQCIIQLTSSMQRAVTAAD